MIKTFKYFPSFSHEKFRIAHKFKFLDRRTSPSLLDLSFFFYIHSNKMPQLATTPYRRKTSIDFNFTGLLLTIEKLHANTSVLGSILPLNMNLHILLWLFSSRQSRSSYKFSQLCRNILTTASS